MQIQRGLVRMATVLATLGALGAISLLAPPAAAAVEKRLSFAASELKVNNLIGEVRVTGGGAGFEVVVRIDGSDADLGLVDVTSRDGDPAELTVTFPDRSNFVYPRLGAGSKTRFTRDHDRGGGWLGAVLGGLLGGDSITVSGRGTGVEVWADIEVRVPNGARLTVNHGVGTIAAENVDGTLVLSTRSGDVSVDRVGGDLTVDTGSGDVRAVDVHGTVLIDTGSGDVELTRAGGDSVEIDTGSGDVTLSGIDTRRVLVDTGSGDVQTTDIGSDSASIDTGSGDVTLDMTRMGTGGIDVDTGSGRVVLRLPAGAGADVEASTGSGGIDVDLGDASIDVRRHSRDEMSFRMGGGGARVRLDTGSGGISISVR